MYTKHVIKLGIVIFLLSSSAFAQLLIPGGDASAVSSNKVKLGGKNGIVIDQKSQIMSGKANDSLTLQDNTNKAINRTKGHGQQNQSGFSQYVFKNTKITTPANVIGKLKVEKSILNADIGVVGSIDLEKTIVNKKLNITGHGMADNLVMNTVLGVVGTFKAKNSVFSKDIIVNNGTLILINSQAKSIKMSVGDVFSKRQHKNKPNIVLDDHTIVRNIKFSSGEGVVLVKDGSKIEGKVTSGKVIYHKS